MEKEGDAPTAPVLILNDRTVERIMEQEGFGPAQSDPPDEVEQQIMDALFGLISQEVCHEIHREVKTGLLNVGDIYTGAKSRWKGENKAVKDAAAGAGGLDIYSQIPSREPKYGLTCTYCNRPVSVLRYAPHLDKCMGKNRGVRATSARKAAANSAVNGVSDHTDGHGQRRKSGAQNKSDPPRRPNKNHHPNFDSYYLSPVGPFIVRLQLEDGVPVRALPPPSLSLGPSIGAAAEASMAAVAPGAPVSAAAAHMAPQHQHHGNNMVVAPSPVSAAFPAYDHHDFAHAMPYQQQQQPQQHSQQDYAQQQFSHQYQRVGGNMQPAVHHAAMSTPPLMPQPQDATQHIQHQQRKPAAFPSFQHHTSFYQQQFQQVPAPMNHQPPLHASYTHQSPSMQPMAVPQQQQQQQPDQYFVPQQQYQQMYQQYSNFQQDQQQHGQQQQHPAGLAGNYYHIG